MEILDRIIELLGSRDQKELTDFLGLKKTAFTDWKSGKSNSYRKYLVEIADFFGVSLDYLVKGNTYAKTGITNNDIKFALFNGVDDITDEMFDEVKQFAQMVKMREDAKRKETK